MPYPVSSVVDQVARAMSVAGLRHQVIVNNIANRDTQGYQRLKVEFDRALAGASVSEPGPAAREPRATVVVDRSASPMSLEQDMVDLSSNALRYQALAKSLGRYFSILSTIANNGRA